VRGEKALQDIGFAFVTKSRLGVYDSCKCRELPATASRWLCCLLV